MYLVTKVITCDGCNFQNVQEFLNWHNNVAGFNGSLFSAWLQQKQSEGKLIYVNSNLLAGDRIENIYLFADEDAYNDYEDFLAAEPMASSITASQANGVTLVSTNTEAV